MAFSEKIQLALLSKGFFPKELPPVFTTVDFGRHSTSILKEWEEKNIFKIKYSKNFSKVDGEVLRGKKGFSKIPNAEPEIISKPKRFYERRNICITHPVPQALLAQEIAQNWKTIQKWLSRQIFSEDRISVSNTSQSAIKAINFQLHRAKIDFIEATADWLIKTDIARFYPSIYTHSIPWAAYGKQRVKNSLKTYNGSLADRIDILVRSCNRNQTVGIPIGPETSRILAEIISSRIDHDFSAHFSNKYQHGISPDTVDRLQDDWTLRATSQEEAENILSVIIKCYREYGLDINGTKTSITHLMKSTKLNWRSEIASFLSHQRSKYYLEVGLLNS